jgi:Ca-activated chloride channel family protein
MFSDIFQQLGDLQIALVNPWIWWLLPLPVVVFFFAPAYRENSESVQIANLEDLTSAPKSTQAGASKSPTRAYIIVALIWLGLLTAAARPEQISVTGTQEVSVRDILLVLDISGSMAIRDMLGDNGEPGGASRMEVMKEAVSEFIEKREYDNIGLIVFGSQALPLTPISQDHVALLEQIDEMAPGMAGPQTSIGDAIGVAIRTYQQSENDTTQSQAEGDSTENFDKERMVVLLTDGLDTSSVLPPRVALRLAEKQKIIIHTIAFGDTHSDDSSTSIDLKLLEDIAIQTQGSFHQASESLDSLQRVYDAIDKLAPRKVVLVGTTVREPLFTYPLIFSLIMSASLMVLTLTRESDHG